MKLKHLSFNPKFVNRKFTSILIAMIVMMVLAFALSATIPAAVQAQATATATNTATTAPTNTPTPTALATALANTSGNGFVQYLRCGSYSFGQVTPGACLSIFNGSDIEVFSSTGRRTWYLDGETGQVTRYTGGTGADKCWKGQQTVLGSATVIPATLTAVGISTPAWVSEGFAASPGNTYWQHSHTNAAGVVTLNVYQNILSGTVTPQAATTSVAIDYEVCGN